MRQPEIMNKNWRFCEPINSRIQNRLRRSSQKTRGPDGQIVLLRTFECIICNTEEGMMSELGSQFVYCGELDANCFIPVCSCH
jgi:hypothetical protein